MTRIPYRTSIKRAKRSLCRKNKAFGFRALQLLMDRKIMGKSNLIIAPRHCFIPKDIRQDKKYGA
jgi:hypothetical protein